MDQARLRTNDGYARISHVAWRLMRRRVAVQMVILATVVLTCSAAHALTPTDGIQGVYSAQDRQSETSLYAILQQLPKIFRRRAICLRHRRGAMVFCFGC